MAEIEDPDKYVLPTDREKSYRKQESDSLRMSQVSVPIPANDVDELDLCVKVEE